LIFLFHWDKIRASFCSFHSEVNVARRYLKLEEVKEGEWVGLVDMDFRLVNEAIVSSISTGIFTVVKLDSQSHSSGEQIHLVYLPAKWKWHHFHYDAQGNPCVNSEQLRRPYLLVTSQYRQFKLSL